MQELLKADPIISLARPELLASPYPAYRWLLENQPVFWYEPLGSWVVTRHTDCVRVLRDNVRFAADWRKVGERRPPGAASIQALDPPEHTVIRHLMVDALRIRSAAQVERLVAEEADALLTRLAGRTSFDLVRDFAQPLALSTITEFLGVRGWRRGGSFLSRTKLPLEWTRDWCSCVTSGTAKRCEVFVAFPARRDEHLNRIGTPFFGKGRKVRRREIERRIAAFLQWHYEFDLQG
jgi:hypothetical protein